MGHTPSCENSPLVIQQVHNLRDRRLCSTSCSLSRYSEYPMLASHFPDAWNPSLGTPGQDPCPGGTGTVAGHPPSPALPAPRLTPSTLPDTDTWPASLGDCTQGTVPSGLLFDYKQMWGEGMQLYIRHGLAPGTPAQSAFPKSLLCTTSPREHDTCRR